LIEEWVLGWLVAEGRGEEKEGFVDIAGTVRLIGQCDKSRQDWAMITEGIQVDKR